MLTWRYVNTKKLPLNTNQYGNGEIPKPVEFCTIYIECNVEIPPEVLEDCNTDGERPKTYTDVSGANILFSGYIRCLDKVSKSSLSCHLSIVKGISCCPVVPIVRYHRNFVKRRIFVQKSEVEWGEVKCSTVNGGGGDGFLGRGLLGW